MEKTLFIHIGAHKTATSAIQTFLSQNREVLKKKGVLYPGFRAEHHEMSHEYLNNTLSQIEASTNSPTKKILTEMINSPCGTCVVSSEGFCKLWDNIPNLRKMIPKDFHVKIIYYVRRQDDQLEAVYNQVVRDPKGRETHTFQEYIGNGYLIMMDYEKVLAAWEESFGKENIIVRCYEKNQLKTNIFIDFLDAIGMEMDDNFIIPEGRINPSLDWDIIEFIRICNINFKDNKMFHNFLMQFFEKNEFPVTEKKYLLSPPERRRILSLYEKSNMNVAKRYLGRDNATLFYDPLPDPNAPFVANPSLDVEKVVPILTKMLYDMDIRCNFHLQQKSNKLVQTKYPKKIYERLYVFYLRFISRFHKSC
jgi:hypothetical protein